MEIYLTQEIRNEDGYVDMLCSQIKSIPKGESLNMSITCVGGDTFQGDRLFRAITEHEGHTKATVVGLAASMGAVLLAAFDQVEIDHNAEIMLHKAHIPDVDAKDYTDEQKQLIDRFNRKAYVMMIEKGVDNDLLDDVFLSESNKDRWLTAKQAENANIGKSVKVERRDGMPFKVAAKLNINQIKNEYQNKMGLFNKNKTVTRVLNLPDGRTLIFNSEKENLSVGDKLILANSSEQLERVVDISDTIQAVLNAEGEVIDLVENKAKAEKDEKYDELMDEVKALKQKIAQYEEKEKESQEAKAKAKAEKDEEIEAVRKNTLEAKALLEDAIKVARNITGNFKPINVDNKHEGNQELSHLSDSERRAIELRNIVNQQKIK
jgi:ATP-dependent protease ClpP protease subunit